MKVLVDTQAEYGWGHHGVRSWGGNWPVRACNEALEQIRGRIASMVNLKELETFTKRELKESMNASGKIGKDSADINIASGVDKGDEEKVRWVNQNNYFIDVSDVAIKPETMYSRTENHWREGRSWTASATMTYRVRIYGND